MNHKLSPIDAFALRRKLAGKSIENLSVSPMVGLLIDNTETMEDALNLQKFLGAEMIAYVFSFDPQGEPPNLEKNKVIPIKEDVYVPPLPEPARLSDEVRKAAESAGSWLDDAMTWATKRSPMTPEIFLEAGLMWTLGLAVARRLCLRMDFAEIFPNDFTLWVSDTSIYKKSTGLALIEDLIESTIPHMRLAEDNTPESLMHQLAGQQPINYDSLTLYEKKLINDGIRFAAQRGILMDEASSMFGNKDYMKGYAEVLMRGFDARPVFRKNLKSVGMMTIRNAHLSILGATTPAALAANLSNDAYGNGLFARFLPLTPTDAPKYVPATTSGESNQPPDDLKARLLALYNGLPEPPKLEAFQSDKPPVWEVKTMRLEQAAFDMFNHYSKALNFDLLLPEIGLDRRLRGNYSRLPVYVLKKSIQLAAIDWADQGADDVPSISVSHIARAQTIIEEYRKSLHRALEQLSRNDDIEAEASIKNLLRKFPNGMTLTQLNRSAGVKRRDTVRSALEAMVESGEVAKIQTPSGPRGGRPATIYSLDESA